MEFPDLEAVKPLPDFRIWVSYSDGTEGEVDLSHLVGKGVFRLWDDPRRFEQVHRSVSGAIAWDETVEICPDATYLRLVGQSYEEQGSEPPARVSHAGA